MSFPRQLSLVKIRVWAEKSALYRLGLLGFQTRKMKIKVSKATSNGLDYLFKIHKRKEGFEY